MASLLDHNNLVVVHYNQYSGGKFFINCLAHTPGVLPGIGITPPDHGHDLALLDRPALEFESLKIKRIASTLPELSRIKDWAGYELGCKYFWGGLCYQLLAGQKPNPTAIDLLQNNICFLVNHDMREWTYKRINMMWPNAQHIILYSSIEFQQLARNLKNPHAELIFDELPTNLSAFYLNVDLTFFDHNQVKKTVRNCLSWLGVGHAQISSRVDNYINDYINLHHVRY